MEQKYYLICETCGKTVDSLNQNNECDKCVTRIEAYEEKQDRKLERYQELASKNKEESQTAYERSNSAVAGIPMGQPILVGHHSERSHRAALKRCHSAMDKSIELNNKAEHYEDKANGIINNNAISSDDPRATIKLKEKLKKLEEQRVKIKEFNKKERKEGRSSADAYILSNLGQNIRSVKERIKHLEKLSKIEDKEEEINGIKLKINKDDNRVQLFFPGKPNEEIRTKLKQNGFHWSPYNGCWQAFLKQRNIENAREI